MTASRSGAARGPEATLSFRNIAGDIVLGPLSVSPSTKVRDLQKKVAEFFKQSPSQVDIVMGARKLLQTDDLSFLDCDEALVLDVVINSPAMKEVVSHQWHPSIYEVKDASFAGGRLASRSLAPGASVFLEDRVMAADEEGAEYRVWSPYICMLIAAVANGIGCFPIEPGTTVLFPRVAPHFEPTVSHVSDVVGATGRVLVVDSSRSPASWAGSRSNIVELSEGALQDPLPDAERADVVVSGGTMVREGDLAVTKQWLKRGGGWTVHVIGAIGGDPAPSHAFGEAVLALRRAGLRPCEQICLGPFHRDTAVIVSQLSRNGAR